MGSGDGVWEGDRPREPLEHERQGLRRQQVRGPLCHHGEGEVSHQSSAPLNIMILNIMMTLYIILENQFSKFTCEIYRCLTCFSQSRRWIWLKIK